MSSEDKTLEPSDHGPSPAPGSTAATPVGSPATTDKRPRGRPRKDGIAVPQKTRKKCRSRGKAALDDEDSMDSVGPAEADPVLEPADTQAQPVDRVPIPCAERTEEEPVPPPLPLEPAGGEMRSSEPLCAFCYCGERSLLGQGELKRFGPTPGYAEGTRPRRGTAPQKEEDGDGSLGCRTKEQSNTVPSTETPFDEQTGLFLEEFGQVGLPDDIDISHLFEPSGHCWAHQSCAVWSHGVCQQQDLLRNVDRAVDSGSTKHCTYCKRLGATVRCCEELCHRWYHYPCAAAAGTFQDIQSHCLLCPEHIEQAVEKACEGANCAVCDSAGDLLDQLFCTSCGQHYHGLCLDIAVTPLKRAGWQCPDCKICQTCRNPGEDSKMLVCDTCDKGYHTFCLQPVMESIPTNGWRCKKCRVCEQCGTRSSPQWHHNSLLCDNCYQQTDDSLACLLCGKPVHVALQKDMMCCQMCKRWIHLECEKPAEDETLEREREHYVCPHCKVAQVEGSSELQVAAGVDLKESESESEAMKETTAEATSSEEVKAQSPGGLAASPTDVAQDEAAIPERTSHTALLSAELCDPKGQKQESDNLAEAPSRQSQQEEEEEEEEVSGLPEEGLAEGSGTADTAGPQPMDLCVPTELKPPDAAVVEGGAEEEGEEEEEEDDEDEEDEDDDEVSEMDSTPASERSFSELSSPAEKPSPNSKLVAPPATLGPIVPPPFIPVPPKIGMGKPAITKRKFSPGRPRIRQGAWNTHNLVSSPLWAPERCEGWDTPRSRQPSASSMWSIKVGRGSGFPGKRRPRGANLSGRGGRGRAKLKNGIGAILAPGVGLLDMSSVKDEEENSMHNTVVLFSNSDRFTLKQDMCVVCGSFGRGAEGRLLACSQCGQCYHPYCVSIKITKVVLSKGWRCLECTVCEACGKATDPGRLLLCDDCDISYHTYCLEPPLQTVPKGGWKCKWCVSCTHCGATTPGPRCEWQNNYTQCAPCASLATCPVCCRNYREDELIVQCQQCNRWIHACCENLNSEEELEAVADVSFDCTMCRNFNVQAHGPIQEMMESSLTAQMVAKLKEQQELSRTYTQDGVCLTESGLTQLQSLTAAMPRRKRPKPKLKLKIINQNSVAVLQTPPELQSEHSRDGDVDDSREGELLDCDGKSESSPEREPADDDAKGTEGVDGVKKRKRKPYRPGIGGFMVRQRSRTGQGKAKRPLFRKDSSGSVSEQLVGKDEAWTETLPDMPGDELLPGSECLEKTKKRYRKKKNKLEETFPAYLQEAFFGKDLLDTSRQIRLSLDALSDEDPTRMDRKMAGVNPNFLDPSSDPLLSSATTSVSARPVSQVNSEEPLVDLSEVLTTDDDLLGILSDELCKPSTDSAALDMGTVSEEPQPTAQQSAQRAVRPLTDEPLDGILSPELDKMVTDGAILSKLYKIPELEGKDVEELFTAVLSPTASLHAQPPPSTPLAPPLPLHGQGDALFPRAPDMNGLIPHFPVATINPPGACIPNNFAHMHRLPYPDSGRDKKPPFNQLVTEPTSAWTTPAVADGEADNMSNAQRSTLKWEKEETLGDMATVAPVLYTNINYPNLKEEFPEWSTRVKQIAKLWRKASSQDRAPYVQKARDNRAALRINKVQLSNDSLKRQHQHQELIDPGMHLDSELLIKDPQKHKESEHEQEWKFRQQMRQKSKQQAKIEATQKLEQVKSEQQQQQLQQQQQQQQQQLPTVGSEAPSSGHQSPLTPQPNNGSLSPAKDGFAHPQLCTTPTPAAPPDDVFLRPQAPPPTPTRVPAQDGFSQPPSPHVFSPGNSSSSRPASPWDPYAKMVGTPRPPAAGPAPPRRSSVDCRTPPSAAERGRPSPAHDSFGSPTPLGGDVYAKPPDTPRPAGAPMRGGVGVENAGDASSRKSMYNRMPQPRMILSDPYSRPLLASMPGSNESGSDALFKAPRPPLVSQDPSGPRSDLCGPRPSVGEQFPQAPRVLRQPPGEPFSQPRAAHDPYARPPGTPRPISDLYSQSPSASRPSSFDPYAQMPPTSRAPSMLAADPYSQPPGTPRPVHGDPYSQPPGTPRPVHGDPYSQPPGTPQPHPPLRPVLGDRFSESSAGARSLDPYSQPPGTPRPVAGEPYSQPPRAPRSLPSDPYAQPPGTPRPGACEAFARPAATRPGLVPNQDSFLAAAQSRGVGSQDGFPLAPDACPPALKVPGKCDEPFSNHDPYEQQPMTPRPPPPGRLPTDAELPAASQEGSFVAPSAQKMPQTSSETPPAENEERLRQRLRELILRQQQHKIAVRQEKGLPDAAMPPHHWPQDDSGCQEDLFSRPPPPYPGTMRGPPRFPGSFAGDQNGSFPAEGPFGRPPYPGDVRPHGARFGFPPGPMAGQERFLGPTPPLPVPGQMLGLPQQLRRAVAMDASRHALPKHFPPQAIQMAQHNILGQPFIELRHRPPESRFRLPFGPPVMEPPPRGGCAPEQQVGFPGNAAIAGQMVPQARSASNPAGGERLRVPVHPGEDLPVAARHGVPEDKLEADDSAVKDLDDVEVKDLDDADLETLNLEDGKGDDLDLEANDLHLDDLLQSGKFDIIAYTDPELNSEDKKDMFNEELELSDHTEERAESAGEGPGGPSHVKSECVEELCSEVAPTDDGADLVAADCRDGSAEPSEDLPDLLTKEPEDGTAGASGPLTSPPARAADTPAGRGATERVAGHEVQAQFVSAHAFVEPGLTGQPPAVFPPPPPPSKERPLLLDEQPLLLQDLLDQERQEQQQQRQMQAMIRQRSSDSFFPNIDFDAITDPIMKAKMVALNGINKVMVQTNMVMPSMINRFPFVGQQPGGHGGDRAVIPPQAVGPDGKLAPQMARPNPPSFGPGFVDDAQKHKYEEWLQDTQQLLQMQQKFLEEQIGAHRKSKKALLAKQRTARKAGREFPEEDAEQLKHVTEQQSLVQKQLEQIRKQQKEHGELIEEYRIKQQQHCGGTPSMMGPPGAVDQQAAFPFQPQQHAPPPRMPGWPPPVRLQSRMPQPVPAAGALPVPVNGAPHVKFDDNNPFSEGFQERERKERLREQQERQRVQLMQEVERQRVLQQQQQFELGGPQMTNRASLSRVPFFTSELPQDFLQPQRPPPLPVGQVFPPQHGFIGAPRFMQGGERRPFAQEAHPPGPSFHPMSHALQCPPRPPAFGPAAEPATLLPPNYPGSGQSLIQLYSNIIPEEKGKKKKKRSRKKKKDEEEEEEDDAAAAESVQTPSTPHSDPASTPTRTLLPHGQGEREPQPATTGQPPSELERQLSSGSGARQAAVTTETDEPSKALRRVKLEKVECQVSEEPMDEPHVGPVKMEEAKDGGSSLEKPGLALGAAAATGAKGESGNELLKHLLKSKSLGQHQRSEESGHSGDGAVRAGDEAIVGTFGVDAPRPPPAEQDKKKPRSKRVPRTGDKCASRSKKRKKDEEERQALCPSTDALMSQLKQQLSLLPLMEPIISVNLAHFSPYGSGRLNGESRLTGTFGSASLDGVSDYYSQLIYKQNNLSNPPTPPASLPPTPPPGVRQKLVNGFASTEELDGKVTVMSGRDVSRCLGAKPLQMPFRPDEDLLARAMAHGPKMVDVPASLPTPPHNNQEELRCHEEKDCEEPDPVDSFVPSSSPESVVGVEVSRYPDLSLVKEEPPDPAASPVIPMLPSSCGKGSEVRNCAVKMEPLYGSPFTSTQSSSRDSLVSIAITLNSAAAENISGVVAAVADFLRVSIPNSYEVSCAPERADGPALGSLKMQQQHQAYGARAPCAAGPNKFVSRACGFHVPGSLLNARHSVRGHGGPKPQWCCHCKVVVLGNGVRKAIRDLPGKREEKSEGSLVFCSHNCMVLFSRGSPDLKDATQVSPVCSFREPLGKAPHPYSNHTSALDVHCLPQLQTKESPPPTPPIAFPPAAAEAKADELKVTVKLKPRPRTVAPGPDEARPLGKKWKGARWRKWSVQVVIPKGHFKLPGESDVDELLKRLCAPLRPEPLPRDHRKCCFCHEEGDGTTDGPARLLNLDLDVWVHLNCALWSTEVYETQAGALMNVELALRRGLAVKCVFCHKTGATGGCHRLRCTNIYHFTCALKAQCMFFKDKTMLCHMHKPRGLHEQELRYFAVFRRVYVQRDEVRQIASIVQRGERDHTFRVGSLIFHSVGQLLPQQLRAFHSACAIFPVGYEASRIYWSTRHSNRRCRYLCSIDEKEGLPEFSLRVVEQGYEDLLLTDTTPKGVWDQVLRRVAELRSQVGTLKLFPVYLKGEDLFGLSVSAVTRIIESLPGVEACDKYTFRYGRNPLMELPLAINPTGCARSEPRAPSHVKRFVLRPHTLNSSGTSKSFQSTVTGELNAPYSKQFVHSKSSQYRKMKAEWKSNVYLARSRIQGLGLYAARDIEKHTMVIEYIGTVIRNEVANRKEKLYESQNRGVYMFRIDNGHVIDATLTGGPARYINHSCAPNCVAEGVTFEKGQKIIISSNRRIQKGEELCYDYKFDFEDDQHKIPCHCGAVNCRKWMN